MSNADANPTDGRDETQDERSDRNWSELLQEIRATQTGTQILSGFLLTLAFQPRFESLDAVQHGIYLVLVVTAALTTVAALFPVGVHRALFGQHLKPSIVRAGHAALRLSLVGTSLLGVGTVMLIFDVVVGRPTALAVSAAVAVVIVVVALVPRRLVRRR